MKKILDNFLGADWDISPTRSRTRSNSLPGRVESTSPPPTKVENKKWTLTQFEKEDLSRNKFGYQILCNLLWWPDSTLQFLKILRFAYIDFISFYSSTAEIFDMPLRNFLSVIEKNKHIKEAAAYLALPDKRIPDYYFNIVVNEDNCYMNELEDHPRSRDEQKHYLLIQAISKIFDKGTLGEDKDSERLVRVYLAVYKVKNIYATVDDILRSALKAAIEGDHVELKLPHLFKDFREELNNSILGLLKIVHDDQLFTKICIIRDLLTYAYLETAMFEQVFLGIRPSPISQVEFHQAEYVYNYYHGLMIDRQIKSKIIQEQGDLKKIQLHLEKAVIEPKSMMISPIEVATKRLDTPRYARRYDMKGDVSLTLSIDDFSKTKIRTVSTNDVPKRRSAIGSGRK